MDRIVTLPLLLPLLLMLQLDASASAQTGALDPSFDGDGIRTEDFDTIDRTRAVALQGTGEILVFGKSQGDDGAATVVPRITRYHSDGSLDQSWTYGAGGGICGTPQRPRVFHGGAVEPDGSILTAGYQQHGCGFIEADFEVLRIDPETGSIVNAGQRPAFQGETDVANDLVRQGDGKIVAVGHSYGDVSVGASTLDGAIARYNANLTLDTSFGTNGEVLVDVSNDLDSLAGVALQEDGKIVAVGRTNDGSQQDLLLVRLDTDGSFDTSFDGDGIVTTDFHGSDDSGRGVAIQPDGKIVVAGIRRDGSDVEGFTVLRYDTDGSVDTSFSTDGMVVVDFEDLPARARKIAIQGDDKLVVAGRTQTGSGGDETNDFAVARLDPTGALDPSFAGDGRQTVDVVSNHEDQALGLVLEPFEGHAIVVGLTREVVDGITQEDMAAIRLIGDSCSLSSVLDLDPQDVDSAERFQACDEVLAGTGSFRVLETGDVTFRAGSLIVLEDGFEVQSGGSFRAVIE